MDLYQSIRGWLLPRSKNTGENSYEAIGDLQCRRALTPAHASRRPRGVVALILLAMPIAAGDVAAQDSTDRGSWSKGNDFELTLTLPFLYSSSVVRSDTDNVVADVGDGHADPDFELRWKRQFSHIKLSALAGVTLERYATVREADVDALTASVKAELTDGRSDLFVPYFRYEQTIDFTPVFKERQDTVHDLSFGFTSGIGFTPDWKQTAYGKGKEPGHSSLKLDVEAGRRFADPSDLDRVFVGVGLEFKHTISKQWAVSITPEFNARWYADYFGEQRRDYRPSIELIAEWTPDWLTRQLPDAMIEFILLFERNYSNLPDQRYKLYEFGPRIVLSTALDGKRDRVRKRRR
jgi:hypothetical protein